ncbi:hypothetical protein H4R33_000763 [Dimargaris cristalligena]|nr:hypothetical protein H4R33_000763 [Dimargaris cristalligena]
MSYSYYYHSDFTQPASSPGGFPSDSRNPPGSLFYATGSPFSGAPDEALANFEPDESVCVVCARTPCVCPPSSDDPTGYYFGDCPTYQS